jgi:serine/threonine protein kinase
MTLNTVLWSVLGTTVATIISRVLYGLRQQVAEANELGQYVLEGRLGGGGMGEVWRARHRLLIRPAAIKLIRPEAVAGLSGDPATLMRRFEREARATASLKSPHTVQLYDFGATDDGRLYYVMELLDGSISTAWFASTVRCRRNASSSSCAKSARHSSTPMTTASSTATSSRPTS